MNLSESNESKIQIGVWFVYICRARTGRYYTGITKDPLRRLERHNSGRGSRFAVEQGPFELVYVSLGFFAKHMARRREVQIKGWSRSKKEKLIRGEWV